MAVVCWLSSMLSLTTRRSSRSAAISSSTGATTRHGAHHGAQKSTSTGVSDSRTSAWKLLSLTSVSVPAISAPRFGFVAPLPILYKIKWSGLAGAARGLGASAVSAGRGSSCAALRSWPIATWDDVRQLALALPQTSEDAARASSCSGACRDRLFVWERPLRKSDLRALGDAAPDGPILGARVEHLVAKEALLADDPGVYFTTPHFDGYAAILVQLERIAARRPRGARRRGVARGRAGAAGARVPRRARGGGA